jgi:glycosyltransferase involved in cell wall biosynthesis
MAARGGILPAEAQQAVESLREADLVVGIPSYNNERTIGHVVRAAHAGLAKYFPGLKGVIVNSDGGSRDGTRDAVLSARFDDIRLLTFKTPLRPVHRLSFPYHGLPGKGSAFRLIFAMAEALGARACAVVDSDLRSITPEWFDLLLRPVVEGGFDFVAPYYHRHKYDGTITNSIVYPMTRALYGKRIRQPIGGDFGMSAPLIRRYLSKDVWNTDVARYGIDIWMTTVAVAEGFRVCQSFLGAKLHDAKDPGSDLSAMLQQVVGSVFALMRDYEAVWKRVGGSEPVELFGFRYDVGLDPINVNLDRMLTAFNKGCEELRDIWKLALRPGTLSRVLALSRPAELSRFHIEDELWAKVVYEFAHSFHRLPVERGLLLRSVTPLYLARVASFVIETQTMGASEVEERIEHLCMEFENQKPYLIALWDGSPAPSPVSPGRDSASAAEPAGREV